MEKQNKVGGTLGDLIVPTNPIQIATDVLIPPKTIGLIGFTVVVVIVVFFAIKKLSG